MSDKYAAIAAHWAQFPVTLMCRVLDISCSGFYAAQGRVPSARTQADEPLRVQIRTAFRQSRKRFGAPRIMRALRAQCVRVSTKRIARLMQTDGLQGRRPRRFVLTTQRNPADRVAPNLLNRDFDVRRHTPAQYGVGERRDVHSDAHGLVVSRDRDRSRVAPRRRMGHQRAQ